jgi:hypothetical protein
MPPLKAKFRLTLFQIETKFVHACVGFVPGIRTGSVWRADQHLVEQPSSTAASSFFTGPRRGKCHGKNSHFQESLSVHQVEYYRHSALAIVGVITSIAITIKR